MPLPVDTIAEEATASCFAFGVPVVASTCDLRFRNDGVPLALLLATGVGTEAVVETCDDDEAEELFLSLRAAPNNTISKSMANNASRNQTCTRSLTT